VKINEITWQELNSKINLPAGVASDDDASKTSKFLKQFEIIDNDPITVQWKNQQFQRNATTGQWVNFPGGKPISQQMVNALDRISPPPPTEPAPPAIKGAQVGSRVKDRNGAVWTKGTDGKWANPDQGVVTDPASIEKLEKLSNTLWNKE
jgi:hypothetical protein